MGILTITLLLVLSSCETTLVCDPIGYLGRSKARKIFVARLAGRRVGSRLERGIYAASTPGAPPVPNRFIRLCGSSRHAERPSSAALRSAEFIPLRLGAD